MKAAQHTVRSNVGPKRAAAIQLRTAWLQPLVVVGVCDGGVSQAFAVARDVKVHVEAIQPRSSRV